MSRVVNSVDYLLEDITPSTICDAIYSYLIQEDTIANLQLPKGLAIRFSLECTGKGVDPSIHIETVQLKHNHKGVTHE